MENKTRMSVTDNIQQSTRGFCQWYQAKKKKNKKKKKRFWKMEKEKKKKKKCKNGKGRNQTHMIYRWQDHVGKKFKPSEKLLKLVSMNFYFQL